MVMLLKGQGGGGGAFNASVVEVLSIGGVPEGMFDRSLITIEASGSNDGRYGYSHQRPNWLVVGHNRSRIQCMLGGMA